MALGGGVLRGGNALPFDSRLPVETLVEKPPDIDACGVELGCVDGWPGDICGDGELDGAEAGILRCASVDAMPLSGDVRKDGLERMFVAEGADERGRFSAGRRVLAFVRFKRGSSPSGNMATDLSPISRCACRVRFLVMELTPSDMGWCKSASPAMGAILRITFPRRDIANSVGSFLCVRPVDAATARICRSNLEPPMCKAAAFELTISIAHLFALAICWTKSSFSLTRYTRG